MSEREPPREVENYTGAFLVSFGFLLFMAFWTLATLAGFVWVLITGVILNQAIRLIALRKS